MYKRQAPTGVHLSSTREPPKRQPGKSFYSASIRSTGGRESQNRRRSVYRHTRKMPRAYGATERWGTDTGRGKRTLRKGTGNGADPVSYTHLDVYKRQTQDRFFREDCRRAP